MKYLIDTHVCLWALFEDERLSATSRKILSDRSLEIVVSQISLYEIAIKHQIGKLPQLSADLSKIIEEIENIGFKILSLANSHFEAYSNITIFNSDHKDPFDRLLLAIADYEKMSFITKDEKFDAYKSTVNIIW